MLGGGEEVFGSAAGQQVRTPAVSSKVSHSSIRTVSTNPPAIYMYYIHIYIYISYKYINTYTYVIQELYIYVSIKTEQK